MEPTQIINDVSKTLYKIIRTSLDPDVKIVFGSPADEDVSGDNSPKLFLFLYNVIENPHFRNLPDEIKGGAKPTLQSPPLAITLQYMIIPSSQSVAGSGHEPPDGLSSHMILAQTMATLHDISNIDPKFYPPDSALVDSDLKITLKPLSIDDISKIWSALTKPFQLSVCYEISAVMLPTKPKSKPIHLVTKTKINNVPVYDDDPVGIPIHDKVILNYPTTRAVSSIRPNRVQPGMPLSVIGRGFLGQSVSIKIDKNTLDRESFVVVNENTIKVHVPKNIPAGVKQLAIDIDGNTIHSQFQVVPASPVSPQITEIKPSSGLAGDMVSIFGVNFYEDAKVTVNGKRTQMTFVDTNQINIVIPNIASGTVKIGLTSEKGSTTHRFEII